MTSTAAAVNLFTFNQTSVLLKTVRSLYGWTVWFHQTAPALLYLSICYLFFSKEEPFNIVADVSLIIPPFEMCYRYETLIILFPLLSLKSLGLTNLALIRTQLTSQTTALTQTTTHFHFSQSVAPVFVYRLLKKLSILSTSTGLVVNGFINVVITTIERRFGLRSTQTGLVASGYDIASFLCLVPVSYFGGRLGASKPRWIGWGVVVMGLGAFVFALPHFLVGQYRATNSEQNVCLALPDGMVNDTGSSAAARILGEVSMTCRRQIYWLCAN